MGYSNDDNPSKSPAWSNVDSNSNTTSSYTNVSSMRSQLSGDIYPAYLTPSPNTSFNGQKFRITPPSPTLQPMFIPHWRPLPMPPMKTNSMMSKSPSTVGNDMEIDLSSILIKTETISHSNHLWSPFTRSNSIMSGPLFNPLADESKIIDMINQNYTPSSESTLIKPESFGLIQRLRRSLSTKSTLSDWIENIDSYWGPLMTIVRVVAVLNGIVILLASAWEHLSYLLNPERALTPDQLIVFYIATLMNLNMNWYLFQTDAPYRSSPQFNWESDCIMILIEFICFIFGCTMVFIMNSNVTCFDKEACDLMTLFGITIWMQTAFGIVTLSLHLAYARARYIAISTLLEVEIYHDIQYQ